MSVDLPALGKPTRPTSASSFISSRRSFSSPGSPGCTLRGARLVDVAKRALPMPPRPQRVPGVGGLLVHERADRNRQHAILARLAGTVGPHAVLAAPGFGQRVKAI